MRKFFLITFLTAFALFAHAQNHWQVNYHQYEFSAVINCLPELDGVQLTSSNYEIGAFCGDELRGSRYPVGSMIVPSGPMAGTYYYFGLTVYANSDGDPITFKLYDHDTQEEVAAICSTTYNFVNNDSQGNPLIPYIITFTSVQTYAITATANPTEGGTTTGGGNYQEGETCTLTATANTGYHFVNWTKDNVVVTTNNTYTLTVGTEDEAYVANFELNSYDITVTANPTAGGTVTGGGTYNHFATCTLTATANTGYHFVNWTKNGSVVSTDANYSFTVEGGGNYVANFQLNSYEITATVNPAGTGSVTGAGTYNHFDNCALTATANTGYHFVNWTKNGTVVSTNATYSFEVTEAAAYVANFEINSYDITVSANPTAGGTVTGGGTYNHFQSCTVTATENTGYHFLNWTKNGTVVSTNTTYTFTVTEAVALVANFEINSYEITATVNPAGTGTVTGAGTYNHFDNCTLTATANTGYHFVNWTKNGIVVSTNANYSFEVTEAAAFVANFEINNYEITTSANPTAGGTTTGDGTYDHFSTCNLTATANEGYHFVNWTLNGQQVSTEANYSFTVEGGGNYVANFQLNSYEITATANPTAGGTITGAGTYNHFETCTLTATENTGYTFINWTQNGQEVSTDLSISFTVEGPAAYVANFQINSYDITVSANPSVGGTAEGDGTYNHFDNCTLTATPSEGYSFVNWTMNGQVVSTSANYSFTVAGGGNYVANFSLNSYNITASANPTVGGTVSGAGTYNHFETCTLTATVNTGYTFINWTRNGQEVSTDLSISFMVEGPAAYVANFQINSYDITVTANPAIGGNVNGGGTYNYGTTTTLTATASEGYTFVNWTKNGSVVSTSPNYSITVTESASYVANFSLNSYNITATANPADGGTVSGAGTYNHFETCTLIATPDENYLFLNWTKNGIEVSTSPTYSFTVTEAGNYVANFVPNEFTINATAVPSNGGTVSGAGVYNYGTTCTLTATPNIGFHFVNWTKDGVVVSTSTTYSFIVTENGSYVAHFDHDDCVITASAEPANGGIVTGAGTYHYNAICTLTATANTGYHFAYWTKDGEMVSNRPAFSITVTENAHYVAHFTLDIYYVTVIANPTQGGTVDGEAAYNYGESCTVTAFAADGYHFVRWTVNGVQVSTDLAYTFTVTGDAEVVGYFALNQYVIEASADPANAGSVAGAGTYTHGQTATLTATPQSGYAFVNWTKDGNVVSSNASYSFTVTESGSYVAHFTSGTHVVTTSVSPAIGGQATGAGTYAHGASCTVVATPNEGFTFVKWTVNGQQVSTQASYTFTVTENIHLKANFVPASCTITAEASPEEGGEVSGAGVYEYGDECTLNATPNADFVFVKWLRDGEMVSETPLYSFTVTGDAHYTAVFASNSCIVTATVDPAEGGTVTGTGTYAYGATVTLTVTPSTNYELVNWTENGTVFSTEETITFVVTGNRDFVANMQEITGVEENGGMTVSLYPNPAKDKLTVEASEPVNLFEIYSINGALVYSRKDCAERIEVYVSDFAVGTYMIRLTTDNNVEVRRFVKE